MGLITTGLSHLCLDGPSGVCEGLTRRATRFKWAGPCKWGYRGYLISWLHDATWKGGRWFSQPWDFCRTFQHRPKTWVPGKQPLKLICLSLTSGRKIHGADLQLSRWSCTQVELLRSKACGVTNQSELRVTSQNLGRTWMVKSVKWPKSGGGLIGVSRMPMMIHDDPVAPMTPKK